MHHAKVWFTSKGCTNGTIYIATDDPSVIFEAEKKYPEIKVYFPNCFLK